MTSVYTRQTTAEGALNQNAPLTNEQLDANFINLNNEKQAALVSGINIKTLNGETLLGPGDVALLGGATYDTNADGKVNAADAADTVPWSGVSGKPSSFTPSAHSHAISDVTALQAALDLKANLASPTFTGTVSGITKSMVGLGNVDNTSDAAKPVSTATQAALNAKQNTLVSGTNIKSVNGATLLGSGNLAVGDVTLAGAQTLTNKTITETVFAVTGTTPALTATSGAVQTWTLTAASTPTNALTSGQSIILVITPGAYAITWPSVTWTKQGGSGAAPTLFSAGKTSVVLWMVGAVLYGSHLGDTV